MEQQPYAFKAQPRKALGYQDEGPEAKSAVNIMQDKRVFRGSTYSSHFGEKMAAQQAQVEKENRRRMIRQRKAAEVSKGRSRNQDPIGQDGVDPIPGHKHSDVQTDSYLEELTDKFPEAEQTTQTDPVEFPPPEPKFIPAKIGVDVAAQVDVSELFDFDLEVEPLLEVLVGKTIEHAMLEVMEEEELKAIREKQELFEFERSMELAEVQRLEAEAKRYAEEKARRIQQETEAVEKEKEVLEKVTARAFAKQVAEDVNDAVFEELLASGKIYDPVTKQMEEIFVPKLIEFASKQANQFKTAQNLLDEIILSTFAKAKGMLEERERAIAASKAAELEAAAEEAAEEHAAEEQATEGVETPDESAEMEA